MIDRLIALKVTSEPKVPQESIVRPRVYTFVNEQSSPCMSLPLTKDSLKNQKESSGIPRGLVEPIGYEPRDCHHFPPVYLLGTTNDTNDTLGCTIEETPAAIGAYGPIKEHLFGGEPQVFVETRGPKLSNRLSVWFHQDKALHMFDIIVIFNMKIHRSTPSPEPRTGCN